MDDFINCYADDSIPDGNHVETNKDKFTSNLPSVKLTIEKRTFMTTQQLWTERPRQL